MTLSHHLYTSVNNFKKENPEKKKRAAKGMSFLSIGSALKNSLRGNIFYVLSRKLNKLLRAFFQSSLFMS